ncbi:MAG: LamG-like jellyroll fold domain-containing protein, partial [Bacteroidota bacterium]
DGWHHLAITVEKVNSNKSDWLKEIYIDGNIRGINDSSIVSFPRNTPLIIGSDGGTSFSGALDNVRFYNRVLNQEQVLAIFNDEK